MFKRKCNLQIKILLPLLGLLSIIFVYANPCPAVSFDLIVPAEVHIRIIPGVGGVGTPWGWIVATETPISYEQLNSRQFTLTTNNPSVTISTTFNPSYEWTPMQPMEIAGTDVSPFTTALQALRHTGEIINPLSENFWRWDIDFFPDSLGDTILTTKLEIDGKIATFNTVFKFDSSYGSETDPLEIVSAQRVTAISEPFTVSLVIVFLFIVSAKRISMRFRAPWYKW